jgi:hypothetical protein
LSLDDLAFQATEESPDGVERKSALPFEFAQVFACHGDLGPAVACLGEVEVGEQGSQARLLLGREALQIELCDV